jgi:uncharacterized protein YecT (DUF1311 family)
MGHLNKTFYSYMTTQDAWDEYLDHRNSDAVFADTWKDTDEDFNEWCENHDIVLVDTRERANQLEEAQLE